MTDMQTSLPLLIVLPSILNPVMHFTTQPLTGEMKALQVIPLPCVFYFIFPNVDAIQAPNSIKPFDHLHESNLWLDLPWMIWSTPYHYMTSLVHRSWPCLLFTVALVHRRQILPKLHRLAVPRFKALTCPSPLQPVYQAKPCLDLLHFGHITPCHVSYAMSSSITLYEHSINP